MSTMEQLFMQIFDRKHWIEGHLRQQADSYGQTLASNLIAEGGRPPPWLWGAGFDDNPEELNREELISRIIFPFPQATSSLANCNSLFMLPTLRNGDISQSNNLYGDTCAPAKFMEDQVRVVPDEGKTGPVLSPPSVVQFFESKQMELDIRPVKKAKTADVSCKESSFDKLTGRVARSLSGSLRTEWEKNSSVSHEKDVHKCSHLRSSARKLQCNELSQSGKALNWVEDGTQEAESQMDIQPVFSPSAEQQTIHNYDDIVVPQLFYAEAVENDVSGAACAVRNDPKMANAVASRLRKVVLLVEPTHLLFDGIGDCSLKNNSFSTLERENQRTAADIALTKLEVVQSTEASVCRDSQELHNPSASRQLHKEDVLRTAEIVCSTGEIGRTLKGTLEEGNFEEPELEDSEYYSHPRSCISEPSQVTCEMADKVQNLSSLVRSSFVSVSMLSSDVNASVGASNLHETTRVSSSGSIIHHLLEEPCSEKHGKVSRNIAPSKQAEPSSSVESKNAVCAGIEESSLYEKSYPENSLMELEYVHSVGEKSVSNVKKACDYSVIRKLHEEYVSCIDEIDRFSDHELAERSGLRKTEDAECDSVPKLCNSKASSVSAKTSLNQSALSCSSPATKCMVTSVVDLSAQLNGFQYGSKKTSLENSLWYPVGGNFYQKFIQEPTQHPIQLINIVQNASKTTGVLIENEEADTALPEAVDPSRAQPTVTPVPITVKPDPLNAQNETIEVGQISWNFDANVRNSNSHSLINVDEVLTPQETVDFANSLQIHAIGQTPISTDNQLELSQTRYFLRSSSSFDKKEGSHKRIGSALHSSGERCKFPEVYISETYGDAMVAAKDIPRQRVRSNSREIQSAQPKGHYLVGSLPTNDQDCAFSKSKGANSEPLLRDTLKTDGYACGITWQKRRKMEGRSNNSFATSPRLRCKPLMSNKKNSESIYLSSPENTSGDTIECEPSLLSNEMDVLGTFLDSHVEELHQTKKKCVTKGDSYLKGKDKGSMTHLPINSRKEVLLLDLADREIEISSKDKEEIAGSTALDLKQYHDLGDDQHFVHAVTALEHERAKEGGYGEEFTERGKYEKESSLCTHDSTKSSLYDDHLDSYNETIPEFEGFSISTPTMMLGGTFSNDSDLSSLTKERVSLLEKFCRSKSILNPVTRPSSSYKIHEVPDVYQPLPSELLEHRITSDSLQFDAVNMKQFSAGEDVKAANPYCNLGRGSGVSLWGRSQSYSIPSTTHHGCDARKPPLTPISVEKLCHKANSRRSSSSSKEVGSNPELICFRIDEDSCSTVQNMSLDELGCGSEGRVDSTGMKNSTKRKALVDVSQVYQNAPSLISISEKHSSRCSLDSVNTESYFGIHMDAISSSGYEYTGSGKLETDDKENYFPSVNDSRAKKAAESFRNMSGKPEMLGQANQRNRSQAIPSEGFKSNNIISNMSSFIPLIQQRQQAAAIMTGKRDIRVKALQAAEAAKRLEQKKQNERETRKAAAKLQRIRLEEENTRKLYLNQKEKEEAKKKEAEFAARKRQREEGGKDKERKRRCIEVQKQQKEKLHAQNEKKELRRNAADEKNQRRKESIKETKKQLKLEKRMETSGWSKVTESEPTIMVVAVHARHDNTSVEVNDCLKELTNVKKVDNSHGAQKAIQDRMSVTKESQGLESYVITPYRDSDGEDGEEDIRRKKKYIPVWARKECLDQIMRSNCHIDSTMIFSRKISFNLNEVLLPRMHMRTLS